MGDGSGAALASAVAILHQRHQGKSLLDSTADLQPPLAAQVWLECKFCNTSYILLCWIVSLIYCRSVVEILLLFIIILSLLSSFIQNDLLLIETLSLTP